MNCPECDAKMPSDGICPSCGHLVIAEFAQQTPEDLSDIPYAKSGSPPPSKPLADPAKPEKQAASPFGDGLLRARDYSAQLLGVAIYSLLLHPTLAYLVFLAHGRHSGIVIPVACAYIPLAWLITRLLCAVEPQTGRWRIRDPYLRAIFMKLNALWFGI